MQLNSREIEKLLGDEGATHCQLQRELDTPPCLYQCYSCKCETVA